MALSKASPYHSINNFQCFLLQKAPRCTSSGSGSRPTHGFKSRDPEVQEAVVAASHLAGHLELCFITAFTEVLHRCQWCSAGCPSACCEGHSLLCHETAAARPGPSLSPPSSMMSPSLMDTQECPSPAHVFVMSPWSCIQLLI